jgi:carotenoid 1,2-hydratase
VALTGDDPTAWPSAGPGFDQSVEPGGYVWWYVDALSDDGRHALTAIAFIGSVFSPYYRWAGRRDPNDHCALNVALYGEGYQHWAMTERGRDRLSRSARQLTIGPSGLVYSPGRLSIDINEWQAPIPTRLAGRLDLDWVPAQEQRFSLDVAGRHVWWPIAPKARIAVTMERPHLHWQGEAYFDSNAGSEPLEAGFRRWTWSRAASDNGTVIFYDAIRREGGALSLALRRDENGRLADLAPPAKVDLPKTAWGIARETRAEGARLLKTLESAPFYARSLISIDLSGERLVAVHESLSLERFSKPWVQGLLPFRMPRRRR